ncbi:MAG: hypothetical protein E7643_01160, partial [Ruminococcaceae bacterium]|nr:hypothetical protein [Oscillospiraceae bacterium]
RLSPIPAYADPAERPASVTAPTVEKPPRRPIEPTPVDPPGVAPTPVADPDKDGIPKKQETYPTSKPTAPVLDALTSRLVEEVRVGSLKKYEGSTDAITLNLTKKLQRRVSITNMKTVIFHGIDGTVLGTVNVNYGDSVSFPVPDHEPSPAYTYRTLGWVTAEGGGVDLSFITEDLDLYPHYEMTKKSYTVTWRILGAGGNETDYSEIWTWGSTPTPAYDVPCTSYETYGYRYVFSGWDKEIAPVEGDVLYVGSFQKTPKEFAIRWVVGDLVFTELWSYGSLPVFEGETAMVSASEECTFLGFSPEISSVTGPATYTARYEKKPYAVGGSATPLSIVSDTRSLTVKAGTHASVTVADAARIASNENKALCIDWDNGCRLTVSAEALSSISTAGCTRVVLQSFEAEGEAVYELHFYNSRLEDVTLSETGITLQLPYREFEDGKTTAFYRVDEAGVRTRIEQTAISVSEGVSVLRAYSYPMRVKDNPLCNTMSLGWDALIGETVSLDLVCEHGYEITGVSVTDAAGNALPIKDLSFVMPESGVDVVLTVEPILYHVVFRSEGKVLLEKTYAYGEQLQLPKTPVKEGDETYLYTFLSWGREVPVYLTGEERELVFEAQFSKEVRNIDYETGHNNNLLLEVVLPCVLGGMLLLGTGLTVLLLLRRRRRRRQG